MAIKKTGESFTIKIPEIKTAHLVANIKGLTPLITNRFSERAIDGIEGKQSGEAKLKKEPRHPEEEFRAACYLTAMGTYGFPAAGVKRAMVTAGQRFAGEKATELYGIFNIPVEMLEIETEANTGPHMRRDRVVLAGIGRTTDIRYRPEFYPWSMRIPLQYNQGFISPDQLINLLRIAGFSVGLGEWRVDKKGSFGQFEIEGFEIGGM